MLRLQASAQELQGNRPHAFDIELCLHMVLGCKAFEFVLNKAYQWVLLICDLSVDISVWVPNYYITIFTGQNS